MAWEAERAELEGVIRAANEWRFRRGRRPLLEVVNCAHKGPVRKIDIPQALPNLFRFFQRGQIRRRAQRDLC